MSAASIPAAAVAPTASASAAWSLAPSSAPLQFRRDADDAFPVAGAVLLVVLLAIAAWAWWVGRARGGVQAPMPSSLREWLGQKVSARRELRVVETLHAGGAARLMVVEWQGGRVLVGLNGTGAPVALDTMRAMAGAGDGGATE